MCSGSLSNVGFVRILLGTLRTGGWLMLGLRPVCPNAITFVGIGKSDDNKYVHEASIFPIYICLLYIPILLKLENYCFLACPMTVVCLDCSNRVHGSPSSARLLTSVYFFFYLYSEKRFHY